MSLAIASCMQFANVIIIARNCTFNEIPHRCFLYLSCSFYLPRSMWQLNFLADEKKQGKMKLYTTWLISKLILPMSSSYLANLTKLRLLKRTYLFFFCMILSRSERWPTSSRGTHARGPRFRFASWFFVIKTFILARTTRLAYLSPQRASCAAHALSFLFKHIFDIENAKLSSKCISRAHTQK